MNNLKKLFPALCLILIAGLLIGTSTFAWFSMNKTGSVTGMQITVHSSPSILIAGAEAGSAKPSDEEFKNQLLQNITGTIEPVSSTDGENFFYVDSKNNVNGAGEYINRQFIAYDPSDTQPFAENYNSAGAVGYVDYVFAVLSNNTDGYDRNLVVSSLALTYSGDSVAPKAFRAAVFVQEDDTDSFKSEKTLVALLGDENSRYSHRHHLYYVCQSASGTEESPGIYRYTVDGTDIFGDAAAASAVTTWWTTSLCTEKITDYVFLVQSAAEERKAENYPLAVSSTSSLSPVCDGWQRDAVIGSIKPYEIKYYKLTVRLWLEGEDATCSNHDFVSLDGTWGLDLNVAFEVPTETAATNAISMKATDASHHYAGLAIGDTSSATETFGGETYYKFSTLQGEVLSTDSVIDSDSKFYVLERTANKAELVKNITYLITLYDGAITVKAGNAAAVDPTEKFYEPNPDYPGSGDPYREITPTPTYYSLTVNGVTYYADTPDVDETTVLYEKDAKDGDVLKETKASLRFDRSLTMNVTDATYSYEKDFINVQSSAPFTVTFKAADGHYLLSEADSIEVRVGGVLLDATSYTWNYAEKKLTVPMANITGPISITLTAPLYPTTP